MRRIFAVLLTSLLISCNSETNTFSIDGVAEGFNDNTELLVYRFENSQSKVIDTITIQGGKFAAKFPKNDGTVLHFLEIKGNNAKLPYFPETENLKVVLYKDSLQASHIIGGRQNEIYNQYSQKQRRFNSTKQEHMARYKIAQSEGNTALIGQIQNESKNVFDEELKYKKEFIASNNNAIFPLMLLSEMIMKKEISSSEASEILNNLSPKYADVQIAKDIKQSIASMSKTDIGGMAPEFSAPTPEGNMLSLKETLGKYTIIDFWASWCRPCRMENPNVVRVYEKYHDKGLNIISVSLDKDTQKDRWIKAISDDNMDWYHVSNLQFWQDPIAKMYGVRSIPATFLLDEEGKIIGKNLRGAALESKIASLMGQ
ncbi:TlpA disulfide reductase family protein [Ulvibacter antarcticus]|uniref:Peroxiredoxin n=1 Tax=Ulvibacter antarcticus TaxID=442714 RepID=A0A3L9YWX2_9FLAO|nr:TlpA disulfide reductase family protein [Ulvibacter antarcticus]RMA58932.1 peroxiredoxin [Ulvibacter antarcticus]